MARKEILRFSHVRTEKKEGIGFVDFNLSVFAGEIIYLTGIHGSGKHSVIGLFEGRQKLTGGSLYIQEELSGPMDKMKFQEQGIFVIDGSKSLSGNMSLSENFFLLRHHKTGKFLYSEKYAAYETGEILKDYGICCNPMEKVQSLNQCEQYLLSIAKAVSNGAKVLLIDCLELSINLQEYRRLAEILRARKAEGISVIVVDSIINPLLEYSDRAVVVYDGRDLKVIYGEQLNAGEVAGYLAGAPLGEERRTPGGEDYGRESFGTKDHGTEVRKNGILTVGDGLVTEIPWGGTAGLFDLERDTRMPFEEYMRNTIRINKIMWNGKPLSDVRLACIPEKSGDLLLNNMTPGDNLLLPSYRRISAFWGGIPKGMKEHASSCFWNELGREGVSVGELDRVERKILCIRRWILAKAAVLFVENPDMGLDSEGQRRVFALLKEAAEAGILVFVMANNPFTLRTNCAVIFQLEGGELKAAVKPEQFRKQDFKKNETA